MWFLYLAIFYERNNVNFICYLVHRAVTGSKYVVYHVFCVFQNNCEIHKKYFDTHLEKWEELTWQLSKERKT